MSNFEDIKVGSYLYFLDNANDINFKFFCARVEAVSIIGHNENYTKINFLFHDIPFYHDYHITWNSLQKHIEEKKMIIKND